MRIFCLYVANYRRYRMKIKVKYFSKELPKLEVIKKGDWIDLRSRINVEASKPQAGTSYKVTDKDKVKTFRDVTFTHTLIPLGVGMELPEGFEALIAPRGSSYPSFGFIIANSPGVIDNTYKGERDEWKCSAIFLKDSSIKVGEKICQFRIQLSQKATPWQKIKWLFTRKIEFVPVEHLSEIDRGGFGKTGRA